MAKSTRHDANRALFQLAHEVVHVLSPTGGKGALRIEEGLATLFSDEASVSGGWGYFTSQGPYISAKEDVAELLKIDLNAIKAIRSIEPSFSAMTPSVISAAVPSVPPDLATALCRKF